MPQDPPVAHTVLVVDDHPVVRRGLAMMLAGEQWIEHVVEAGTAQEARRLVTLDRPDIAVVDLTLPDGDGVSLIREMSIAAPDCVVLVVTMTNDPGTVRAALDAGARRLDVLKDASPELLIAALRTAAAGGRVLGPEVTVAKPAPTDPGTCRHRSTR